MAAIISSCWHAANILEPPYSDIRVVKDDKSLEENNVAFDLLSDCEPGDWLAFWLWDWKSLERHSAFLLSVR